MQKKRSTKKRTQVKDLPNKKKLSTGDMRKVKGGFSARLASEDSAAVISKLKPKG